MTRYFRMPAAATGPISKFVRLFLFVLIAAHVAHLPVLAHGSHDAGGEQTGLPDAGGDSGIGHDHGAHAASVHQGTSAAALADPSDRGVECMTTAATIPTRAATIDALAMPAAVPDGADAESFSPTAAASPWSEAARRHLVLRVLLR